MADVRWARKLPFSNEHEIYQRLGCSRERFATRGRKKKIHESARTTSYSAGWGPRTVPQKDCALSRSPLLRAATNFSNARRSPSYTAAKCRRITNRFAVGPALISRDIGQSPRDRGDSLRKAYINNSDRQKATLYGGPKWRASARIAVAGIGVRGETDSPPPLKAVKVGFFVVVHANATPGSNAIYSLFSSKVGNHIIGDRLGGGGERGRERKNSIVDINGSGTDL